MRSLSRSDVTSIIADMSDGLQETLSRDNPIPWAFYQFPTNELATTPFLIYFYDGNDDFIADNKNYSHIDNLVIELYISNIDFNCERVIEGILEDNHIVYTKAFSYIEDEEMYLYRYESEILITD